MLLNLGYNISELHTEWTEKEDDNNYRIEYYHIVFHCLKTWNLPALNYQYITLHGVYLSSLLSSVLNLWYI